MTVCLVKFQPLCYSRGRVWTVETSRSLCHESHPVVCWQFFQRERLGRLSSLIKIQLSQPSRLLHISPHCPHLKCHPCCCWVTSVMSDSVLLHRRQPTGLSHPWDSPGKNTGVGCHFLLQCVKVKLLSRVRLLVTPWTAAYQAPPSTGFSRQEYWSGVPLPSPKVSSLSH